MFTAQQATNKLVKYTDEILAKRREEMTKYFEEHIEPEIELAILDRGSSIRVTLEEDTPFRIYHMEDFVREFGYKAERHGLRSFMLSWPADNEEALSFQAQQMLGRIADLVVAINRWPGEINPSVYTGLDNLADIFKSYVEEGDA